MYKIYKLNFLGLGGFDVKYYTIRYRSLQNFKIISQRWGVKGR